MRHHFSSLAMIEHTIFLHSFKKKKTCFTFQALIIHQREENQCHGLCVSKVKNHVAMFPFSKYVPDVDSINVNVELVSKGKLPITNRKLAWKCKYCKNFICPKVIKKLYQGWIRLIVKTYIQVSDFEFDYVVCNHRNAFIDISLSPPLCLLYMVWIFREVYKSLAHGP